MSIRKIADAVIRTYRDTGDTNAYVSWYDDKGVYGCTSGKPDNTHMQQLLHRAEREGVTVRHE